MGPGIRGPVVTLTPASLRPRKKGGRWGERTINILLLFCALISVFTTVGIVLSLLAETVNFFGEVSVIEFLTDTRWTPLFVPQHFGIIPLLTGTLMVAVGAAIVALPIGLATAIYLSEYAPEKVRRAVKPVLEVLAGIPTVVYGYFALTFVTPMIIRNIVPGANFFNAASASLVMGIMIVPMVSSLSEDAMVAVPRSLRESAFALGATKFEVAVRVVMPAALSGIVASFILAISRAIGETMIVTLAAGATPRLTLNPFESIQTMTAYIVQVSLGDTPQGSIAYLSIFAVGMSLFLITLGMNVLGHFLVRRYVQRY